MVRHMNKPLFLPALERTIEHFGSQHKAAKALRIPQTTLSYWLSGKTQKMDLTFPRKVEKLTGGAIKAVEFFG